MGSWFARGCGSALAGPTRCAALSARVVAARTDPLQGQFRVASGRSVAVTFVPSALVVLLFASLAGAVINTGRAAFDFAACNGRVGFPEPEAQQGGTDLNGDGDAFDTVLLYQ